MVYHGLVLDIRLNTLIFMSVTTLGAHEHMDH